MACHAFTSFINSLISVRESKIEKDVCKWAKANGIRPIKVTPVNDGGWLDHMFLYHYPLIAFIEFKAPGEMPDERQNERIAEVLLRGFPAGVFDDTDKAIAFLDATLLSVRRS